MASAKELMKDDKHKSTLIFSSSVTILAVVLSQALTSWYSESKEDEIIIQSKASVEKVKALESEMESKASIEYVNNTMFHHEAKDIIAYQKLEQLIKLSIDSRDKSLERIYSQLDRLENK